MSYCIYITVFVKSTVNFLCHFKIATDNYWFIFKNDKWNKRSMKMYVKCNDVNRNTFRGHACLYISNTLFLSSLLPLCFRLPVRRSRLCCHWLRALSVCLSTLAVQNFLHLYSRHRQADRWQPAWQATQCDWHRDRPMSSTTTWQGTLSRPLKNVFSHDYH